MALEKSPRKMAVKGKQCGWNIYKKMTEMTDVIQNYILQIPWFHLWKPMETSNIPEVAPKKGVYASRG